MFYFALLRVKMRVLMDMDTCFGSLDQVMNDDELVCLNDGRHEVWGRLEGCSTSRAERNKSSNGSSKAAMKIQ